MWSSGASRREARKFLGPLDAEGGRVKLRASEKTASAGVLQSSARAGFEAPYHRTAYPTRRGYLVIVGIWGGTTCVGDVEPIGSK